MRHRGIRCLNPLSGPAPPSGAEREEAMVDIGSIRKVSDYIYEIPRSFRPDMNVPARFYANEALLKGFLGDKSLHQLVNTTTLPGVERYALAVSDEIVRALLDRRCGTTSFARMDETSRQVVVEYALQPLIAGLSPAEITGCSIAKHEDTDGPRSRSAFRVDADCDLKDGGGGPVGIATAAPAVADALRRKIEGLRLAVANDGTFTAPLIIHAGQTRMRRQDLESLAVTDVILVEQSALEDAKAIVKVAGTSIAYFVEVGQYSLTTLERLNGAADEINQPTEQDMSELEETGDIEVDVVFEIGRLDISLEELATLGPGHVFTLGRPLDIAVTIRANNARIGTGDIVFVDDRVGIQISKLKSSD